MIVEALMVGGPANRERRAIPGLKPELYVAHLNQPVDLFLRETDDPFATVDYVRHVYRPTRVLALYEHKGLA